MVFHALTFKVSTPTIPSDLAQLECQIQVDVDFLSLANYEHSVMTRMLWSS